MAAKTKMCPALKEPCIKDECVAWGSWRINPGAGYPLQVGCAYFRRTEDEIELPAKRGRPLKGAKEDE